MIKIHHLNNSRSQRLLWLLEELQQPYELVCYQRNPETMLAPPKLREIHPLGKSPVLEDSGLVLAESGAIIEYLVDRYDPEHRLSPPPGPADALERLRYRYWLHYAEASAMPPLLLSLVFSRIKQAPMPFFARPVVRAISGKVMAGFVNPQLKLHLDYIDAELGKLPWFAGERFTAADIQMSFPLEAAAARTGAAERTNLQRFLERIHGRAAYQRARDRGGPFEIIS